MKRKWICIILSLTLSALLFSSCGTPGSSAGQSQDDQAENSPELSDNAEATKENQASPDTENPVTDQTSDSAQSETEAEGTDTAQDTQTSENGQTSPADMELSRLSDMEKAFDALMLGCFENDMVYDSHDPSFFWTVLYYGITNHTKEIPLAENTEEGIRVPTMAVQEFATGLFADYDQLLQLPGEITDITYDADWDAYVFTPGDQIPLSTRLLNTSANENGSISAAAALYDDETGAPVRCYLFTLNTNPYADGITEPVFSYSVSDMTLSSAVNCSNGLPTLIGSYQGFSDNHTAEFIIDGNLMAFQVYDKEIVSILYLLEENAQVTFAVETDELTESRTITSIMGK